MMTDAAEGMRWATAHARRQGLTLDQLLKRSIVTTCPCGQEGCSGFRLQRRPEARRFAVDRRMCPTPEAAEAELASKHTVVRVVQMKKARLLDGRILKPQGRANADGCRGLDIWIVVAEVVS